MVKQLLTCQYQVKEIVDGPKYERINRKRVATYKVRWEDTYEPAENLDKGFIDMYAKRRKYPVVVLGPIHDNPGPCSIESRDFAVEHDGCVHIYPYKKVKQEFKDQLIEYFEKCSYSAPGSADQSSTSSPRSSAS